jgi:hypothetical protein
MTVSNRSLIMLADALRHRRTILRTRWRRLPAGRQALLVVAHLRKGETYADLAHGFAVGTTTVYRYLREGLDVLAALAPPWPRRSPSPRPRRSSCSTGPCCTSIASA